MKKSIEWSTPKQIQRELKDKRRHATHTGRNSRRKKGYTVRMLKDKLKSTVRYYKRYFGPEERKTWDRRMEKNSMLNFYKDWRKDAIKHIQRVSKQLKELRKQ